ncbi:MAG: MFS transporter, partial [Actinomycetota bacterium]
LCGWVFSAICLGQILGTVTAGRSADRAGPGRGFLAALTCFATGLAVAGAAPTMAVVVVARAVQGVGAGALLALAYVLIGRTTPAELHPRVLAVIASSWEIPALIGPALAGTVADGVGWRWVFWGLLPLVAVAAVITLPAMRSVGPPPLGGPEPPDRRRAAVVLTFGATVTLVGATSHRPIVALPLALGGLAITGRTFLRMLPAGTARFAPGTPAATAVRFLVASSYFGVDAFVALTLNEVRGTGAAVSGLALTGASLTWVAGAWLQERKVRAVGPRRFVRIGMGILAVAIAGLVVTAALPVPIALPIAAWALGGFGMGMTYAPLWLVVFSLTPVGGEGTASAALQLSDTLGIALGTGAVGAVVAAGTGAGRSTGAALAVAFAACAVVAAIASIAAGRLPRRLDERSVPAPRSP